MTRATSECPLRQAIFWACLLAAVALGGVATSVAVRIGARQAAPPPQQAPLATLDDASELPPPDEFPVHWGERTLRGRYMPRDGIAFVVLEQVRGELVPGAPPAADGQDVFALRLGAVTDTEDTVDPALYGFSLTDASGRDYEPSATSRPGRLLPGDDLNLYEVYFPLPLDARPADLTISGRGVSITLPACPVPAQ
jgi:hypothetical protein